MRVAPMLLLRQRIWAGVSGSGFTEYSVTERLKNIVVPEGPPQSNS
jgi:hypothetical protein